MSYSSEVLADAPLAYYRLGETSGTTMVDSSGNGRNGTYVGTPALGSAGLLAGDADTAVDFDGVDDHGAVADAAWMDVNAFTAEAVFRADSTTGDRAILTHTDWSASNFDNTTNPGRSWHLIVQGGQINVGLNFSAGSAIYHDLKVGPVLAVGTTYHVALTWDGNIARLYLTGVEVWNSGTTFNGRTLRFANQPLKVGASTGFNGSHLGLFDGRIDEAAVYGTALSAARIAAHYNASIGTVGPTTVVGTRAVETDEARAGARTVGAVVAGGRAVEVDTALPGTVAAGAIVVGGRAVETDEARTGSLSFATIVPGGSALEVEEARGGTAVAGAVVAGGRAIEIDTAREGMVIAPDVITGGKAIEVDAARPGSVVAPQVATVDTADRAGGRTREGYAVATWSPTVVAPPRATAKDYRRIGAQAFSEVEMAGPVPVYTTSQATKVRTRHRVIIGGRDVSFYRGIATPEPGYQLAEPLLWGTCSVEVPSVSAVFEKPGKGELRWCRKGAPVVLQRVTAAGEVVSVDYRGVVVAHDVSGKTLTLEVGGHATGRAALRHKPLPIFRDVHDLGRLAWAAIRDLGLRFEPRLGPKTGIRQALWGGMEHLTYITELCAKAWERDGTQWTVMPSEAGVYRMKRKDRETVDFTVFTDDSRAVPKLRSDAAEEPNRIFASGVTPKGQRVRFGVYPGLKPSRPAPYPFNDGRAFGPGTTDADTDTGDGIFVMVRTLWAMGYLSLEDASGEYDRDVANAVAALQDDAQVTGELGAMNEDTWAALFDLDETGFNLRGSRIEPAAQAPRTRRYRRSASGRVIGKNPRFNPHALVVDRAVDFGSGFTRHQMREWSSAEIARGEENWVGTVTITTGGVLHGDVAPGTVIDGEDVMDVRAIKPGMNGRLPLFGGGITVHVSGVEISYDQGVPQAVLYVDTQARDAMAVWEIIRRNRETRHDPARRWKGNRSSGELKDSITEFDEVGGVLYDDEPLKPGWNVVQVVAGQEGTIARLRLKVTTEDGDGVEFACAVFGRKISRGRLNTLVRAPLADSVIEDPDTDEDDEDEPKPPPLIGDRAWERRSVRKVLRARWHLYSAGTHLEPCGYSPGRKTWTTTTSQEPNPDYNPDADKNSTGDDDDEFISVSTTEAHGKLTGLHADDAGFSYRTAGEPVLYLAVFVRREAVLEGGRVMWNQLETGV